MAYEPAVTAAGAVVWQRRTGAGQGTNKHAVEVLLVHRPRYDDWTFPKGKPEAGEDLVVTAVREVAEETSEIVRLGYPLPDTRYRVSAGPKQVRYWMARSIGKTKRTFVPNSEVDEIRWVRPRLARRLLTYEHDIDLLAAFMELREDRLNRTRTLVVLRHAKAVGRQHWSAPDLERPLTGTGARQAKELADLLGAYGIRHIMSSPATRCVQTVTPYADLIDRSVRFDERLTEQAKPKAVGHAVAAALGRRKPTVICTHRPTLPLVWAALETEDFELAPGQGVVIHHLQGVVVGTEPLGARRS